jgi:hypothetical protein
MAELKQGNLHLVEIADNARKHGVDDLDIEHAVRNAIRVLGQGNRDLYIGADRAGRSSRSSSLTTTANPLPSTRWR